MNAPTRILVVEDDPILARVLAARLEGMGYEVPAVAHRAEPAIEAAREAGADLALMDIRLPGRMDGIDAARLLADELHLPVVFITSFRDEETLRRASATSPYGYLLKPFGDRQLQTTIELAVHRCELEQALRRSEEKYSKIFRSSPVAIAVTSTQGGRVLEANDAFLALWERTRHETLGRTLDELGWWSFREDRQRALQTLRENGVVREMEVALHPAPGELRETLVSAELLDLDGEESLLLLLHDVSERKRFERKLQHLALHDALTGLPNRTLFEDRLGHALERAEREGSRVAVLFLDLDGFKTVNDTLGHAAGDELLKAVADRIRVCFRDQDTLARIAGDEFAAVLEDAGEWDEVRAAAERLSLALEIPFDVLGSEVTVSVSVGVALARPRERAPEELLRRADVAMYRAKEEAGTSYQVYDADRDAGRGRASDRASELKGALDRDEFRLLYQPVVSLSTGEIVGCEALLRWDHPERGLLTPDAFMSLVEASGLSVPLGARIVECLCRDHRTWRERLGSRDFIVGVNLTARQLRAPEYLTGLADALQQHDFPPGAVQIEVPESVLLQSAVRIRAVRDLDLKVAIDRFGTGFSSLRYLGDLEVDVLKVDGSFTGGIGLRSRDEHILRTIVPLAHGLGIRVAGNWVESRVQHDFLQDAGYDFGQGFLYSTPLAPSHFGALLAAPAPGAAVSGGD